MSKKLQLSIPKPCHENWDAMTPVEKGKFCGSCQKQVVDFSNMSDRQVAEFFKKPSTDSVCGRFMTDQLNRDIEIPKKRIPWLKYFFQFALPAFLVSLKASAEKAQGKIKVNSVTSDTTNRPICDRPTMGIIARPIYDETKEKGITGRVMDAETGKPLPEASVIMTSTTGKENIKVKEDGFFVLDIYRKITVKKIEVSCPGYEKKEMSLQEFMKIGGENRPILLEKQMVLGNLRVSPVCTKPLLEDVAIMSGDTIKFDTTDRSIKGEIQLANEKRLIYGTVTDEKGDPLPGVSIMIKGTRMGVLADNTGSFRILAKAGDILLITGAGLEPTEVTIRTSDTVNIDIKRVIIVGYTVGGLVIDRVKPKKELKKVPLIPITTNNPDAIAFKIFPNPVSSGTNLNIEVKEAEEGYYSFQLLNQSGQSIQQQTIWIDAEAKLLSIDIPSVAAGNYFLVLTNKKSGKRFTEKLILQ